MKKLILSVAAMSVFAFANAKSAVVESVAHAWYQETTKIDPESLPDKVKEAISDDAKLKDLKIAEAHQVMENAQVHYMVKFESDSPGEEIKKKFDAMGKMIDSPNGKEYDKKESPNRNETPERNETPRRNETPNETPGERTEPIKQ